MIQKPFIIFGILPLFVWAISVWIGKDNLYFAVNLPFFTAATIYTLFVIWIKTNWRRLNALLRKLVLFFLLLPLVITAFIYSGSILDPSTWEYRAVNGVVEVLAFFYSILLILGALYLVSIIWVVMKWKSMSNFVKSVVLFLICLPFVLALIVQSSEYFG